ncbi:MAG: hypothetical protein ABW189_06345 [Rickettsiales bacterium]
MRPSVLFLGSLWVTASLAAKPVDLSIERILDPIEGEATNITVAVRFSHRVGELLCADGWGRDAFSAYPIALQFTCKCNVTECNPSRACRGKISSAKNKTADDAFTLTAGVGDMTSVSDPYPVFAADSLNLTYVDMTSETTKAVFVNSTAFDLLKQFCEDEPKQWLTSIAFHRIYLTEIQYYVIQVLFIIGLIAILICILLSLACCLRCCCGRKRRQSND